MGALFVGEYPQDKGVTDLFALSTGELTKLPR